MDWRLRVADMDEVSLERQWQSAIRVARVEPQGSTAVGSKEHYTSEFLGGVWDRFYEDKIEATLKRQKARLEPAN